jgi:hypothetical protein
LGFTARAEIGLDLILKKAPIEKTVNIFFAIFCLLPPVLLGGKFYWKWRISSWWLFVGFVLVGWILVNLTVWRHFEVLADLASIPGASDDVMDAAQNDGATRVFGLYFGWLYAALYFGGWTLALRVSAFVYRRLHQRIASD